MVVDKWYRFKSRREAPTTYLFFLPESGGAVVGQCVRFAEEVGGLFPDHDAARVGVAWFRVWG